MDVQHKDAKIENGPGDEFPGSFSVILSAPTKDRDGEVLNPEDWKQPLPEHITFDADHGMSVATTVGSGVPRIDAESGNLIVDGTYSSLPRAQDVRTLVNEGHIRTTSVAFMSEPTTSKDGKPGKVRELLNGAFVAIPSNREALVLASKGVKVGARNNSKDATAIQAIHDHAAGLGASCSSKAAPRHAEVKSIIGSLEATRERAHDALEMAYPGGCPWLRGTLPDVLIFDICDPMDGDCTTYSQPYTDDGSLITLTGSPVEVDVMEIVTPDADASLELSTLSVHTDTAHALSVSADTADTYLAMRAQALALECEALSHEGI